MITLSLMKLDQPSIQYIDYLASNLRSKKTSSSIAIAKALADDLELPSSRLTPPVNRGPLDTSVEATILNDYRARHKVSVFNKICAINEFVPVSIDEIEALVLKFYKGRYYTLYPQTMMVFGKRPVYDFFNISMGIDEDTIKIIEEEFQDIVSIYKSTKRFFQNLNNQTEE